MTTWRQRCHHRRQGGAIPLAGSGRHDRCGAGDGRVGGFEEHEQQEGFLPLVVSQGLHLDWAEYAHVVHLNELLGHSCFALCLNFFIPAFIK